MFGFAFFAFAPVFFLADAPFFFGQRRRRSAAMFQFFTPFEAFFAFEASFFFGQRRRRGVS
jgi:hypothetical protein